MRFDVPATRDEQYRLLVEAVIDYAIYLLDPEGLVASWNRGAHRLKGYAAGEIIGQHFSRFYTEEDRRARVPQQALDKVRREGKFEAEGWRVRKDGSRFWASVVIDAIRDDHGILIGFAKITRDVTERRDAQIELERAREALFQSQKMEALGQLTGGVAHDFNNLLTAIIGSLELLGKQLPDAVKSQGRTGALLDNAMQAAHRGTWLTRRMLAFARREKLELRPLDVVELVRGMSDLLRRSLGPTVTVETRFPPMLRPALGDPNQLELALLNLAVNARDAMPEGGRLVLAAREETVGEGGPLEAGRYVCLVVTDDGSGMNAATLARAMEPFYTTKGPGKGTGLGLSMVLGMAEQSGGRLTIRSQPGEGTTAELWLRAAHTDADEVDGLARAREQAPQHGRLLAVLAIDDDPLVLMNTAMQLESLGHRVFSATSGRQALDILGRGEPFDLVITDEAMPQMRGSQLAEAIRVRWPDLPVVLATGYAEAISGQEPGLPRLVKPFSQHDLARIIEQTLARRD